MKTRIKYRLKDVQQGLLNHSVADCGNTKQTRPTIALRDLNPTDWLRTVALAPQLRQKHISMY
jgi:hypothetical protein